MNSREKNCADRSGNKLGEGTRSFLHHNEYIAVANSEVTAGHVPGTCTNCHNVAKHKFTKMGCVPAASAVAACTACQTT